MGFPWSFRFPESGSYYASREYAMVRVTLDPLSGPRESGGVQRQRRMPASTERQRRPHDEEGQDRTPRNEAGACAQPPTELPRGGPVTPTVHTSPRLQT